jgi:hypothetical protein
MLWVKRVVLVLVLLNLIQFFFFSLNSEDHPVKSLSTRSLKLSLGKPWPHLASFTSWTVDPDLSSDSCEAFFGNGFTQAFTLLSETTIRSRKMQGLVQEEGEEGAQLPMKRRQSRGSLFQCFYSETLRTSICEGTNMIMYPKKIKMSKGQSHSYVFKVTTAFNNFIKEFRSSCRRSVTFLRFQSHYSLQ